MYGYLVFYRGESIEVWAESSYGAQQDAVVVFQKKYPKRKVKGSDMSVYLADLEQVAD